MPVLPAVTWRLVARSSLKLDKSEIAPTGLGSLSAGEDLDRKLRFRARYDLIMLNKYIFGYPDQWEAFEKRNARFIERFPALDSALKVAFVREFTAMTPAERAIHLLGRLCIEDFMELLCLAANGYGFGALKLLRGLYERVVTTSYLADNPDEADPFLNFRFVSRHKALQAYVMAGSPDQEWINRAEKARLDFEAVKEKFEVDDCKTCGT
jgi:hypothetical protein